MIREIVLEFIIDRTLKKSDYFTQMYFGQNNSIEGNQW
jgi:hypothetical protein